RWAVGNTQDVSSRLVLGGNGVIDPNSNSLTFAGDVTGGGGLTLAPGNPFLYINALNLTGASTYTGGTMVSPFSILSVNNTTGSATGSGPVIVNGGRLTGNGMIAGDVTVSGFLAPGNGVGTINFHGNVTLANPSDMMIEVGGTTPGTQHDAIVCGSA